MDKKYKKEYETERILFYFNDSVINGGYCENGHFCIVPESFEIKEGNKHHCLKCGTLLLKVIKVKVIEEEI